MMQRLVYNLIGNTITGIGNVDVRLFSISWLMYDIDLMEQNIEEERSEECYKYYFILNEQKNPLASTPLIFLS